MDVPVDLRSKGLPSSSLVPLAVVKVEDTRDISKDGRGL